jgi:hypothetical protein
LTILIRLETSTKVPLAHFVCFIQENKKHALQVSTVLAEGSGFVGLAILYIAHFLNLE